MGHMLLSDRLTIIIDKEDILVIFCDKSPVYIFAPSRFDTFCILFVFRGCLWVPPVEFRGFQKGGGGSLFHFFKFLSNVYLQTIRSESKFRILQHFIQEVYRYTHLPRYCWKYLPKLGVAQPSFAVSSNQTVN